MSTTSPEKPVYRPQLRTTTEQPVYRGDALAGVMEAAYGDRQGIPSLTMEQILTESSINSLIKTSNVFILGQSAFFRYIRRELERFLFDNKEMRPLHALADINLSTSEGEKGPLLVVPLAENRDELNKIVSAAFEAARPVWLIGLPSQIEKHLLVLFDVFFLTKISSKEISLLVDLAIVSEADIQGIRENDNTIGIVAITRPFLLPERGKGLGFVAYIKSPQ